MSTKKTKDMGHDKSTVGRARVLERSIGETRPAPEDERSMTYANPLAASVHESISDLYELGIIDKVTMDEFDSSCLAPVPDYDGSAIRNIRVREGASQAVFGLYMGVSTNTVGQWERGERKLSGAGAKLLSLIDRHGLAHVR